MKIQGGRRQWQALDASPSTAGAELMGKRGSGGAPGASGKGGSETQGWRETHLWTPGLLSLPCRQMSPLLLHHGEAPTQGHHTQQRREQLSELDTDWHQDRLLGQNSTTVPGLGWELKSSCAPHQALPYLMAASSQRKKQKVCSASQAKCSWWLLPRGTPIFETAQRHFID